jgi:L-threonylcarbamoyladenylate synthase
VSFGADINKAARLILDGALVAVPTETVYGLAADATNDRAVAGIFAAKKRPSFNPLIAHVRSRRAAEEHAHFNPLAERLADAFWPGPLTLVVPRRAGSPISRLASAGQATLALRAPAHPVMRALLEAVGRPLAAPSANPSGAISPTTAQHVAEGLGDAVAMILDGGPCVVGVESTIVKIEGDRAILLRAGGLARERIEAVTGPLAERGDVIEAPGMMASHYAPAATLRLGTDPHADEAFLAFGDAPDHPCALNLSRKGDLVEAAANLFSYLHALDALVRDKGLKGIVAMRAPEKGLGEAINDRLARAAAPRS